jgi:hypothetical protein
MEEEEKKTVLPAKLSIALPPQDQPSVSVQAQPQPVRRLFSSETCVYARLAVTGLPGDMSLREATNLFLPVFCEGFVQVELLAASADGGALLVASFITLDAAIKMHALLQGTVLDTRASPYLAARAVVLPGFSLESVVCMLPLSSSMQQQYGYTSQAMHSKPNQRRPNQYQYQHQRHLSRQSEPCDTLFLCRYQLPINDLHVLVAQLPGLVASKWAMSKNNEPVAFLQFATICDAQAASATILTKWPGKLTCEYAYRPLGVTKAQQQ